MRAPEERKLFVPPHHLLLRMLSCEKMSGPWQSSCSHEATVYDRSQHPQDVGRQSVATVHGDASLWASWGLRTDCPNGLMYTQLAFLLFEVPWIPTQWMLPPFYRWEHWGSEEMSCLQLSSREAGSPAQVPWDSEARAMPDGLGHIR